MPDPRNAFTLLDAPAGSGARGRGGSASATRRSTRAPRYVKDSTKDMATFLAMLYVLLGFSIVVSLFGMVNTLVLSVFERTRELGMLRAIGMSRRQARRMIRHESVITALIGAVLGLGFGVGIAAAATQALSDYGVASRCPSSSWWRSPSWRCSRASARRSCRPGARRV